MPLFTESHAATCYLAEGCKRRLEMTISKYCSHVATEILQAVFYDEDITLACT